MFICLFPRKQYKFFLEKSWNEMPPLPQNFIIKYKPYFIDDFGDTTFKRVLKTLLEIDEINILIHGPANSGKTSLIYAIIRDYYGLTRYQTLPENNLLFINSLKEQGIQYFRNEMKTFCQSKCSIHGKKKMIVVDDIDIVNEQCQQVFRNYIDKYKKNILFVSSCTNVQKVIESVQSRIHILKMDPMSSDTIREIMQKIISTEGLSISVEARDFLLEFSGDSVRQMMNYLEKIYLLDCACGPGPDQLSLETCKQICSNISFGLFEEYLGHLKGGRCHQAIQIFYKIHDYGYSVIDIFDYFFSFVKTTSLLSEDQKYQVIPFLCKYITFFHSIHENIIELALFTGDIQEVLLE